MGEVATRLTNALVALTALSIALLLFDGSLFGWHPLFMSLGYLGLMSEGVLLAVGFRSTEGEARVAAIWRHMLVQIAALICAVIGFSAIYANKIKHGKSHFLSWHAKGGLATLILTISGALGGMISFKRLGFYERLPSWIQQYIKWVHRNNGSVAWIASLVVIELGLSRPSVDKGSWTLIWQGCVALLFLAVGVQQLKRPPKVKGDLQDSEEEGLPK